MKKKILIPAIAAALITIGGNAYWLKVSEATQDKADVEGLTRDYIGFSNSFHQFPVDKIEQHDLDDVTIQQIIDNKKNLINKYATPGSPFLQKLAEKVTFSMKDQQKGERRSFGGSVTDVQINSIDFSENTAHVDLSYVSHATFGQWQKDHWVKVSPSNKILDQIYFQKDQTGKWGITDEKWTFAPGSHP